MSRIPLRYVWGRKCWAEEIQHHGSLEVLIAQGNVNEAQYLLFLGDTLGFWFWSMWASAASPQEPFTETEMAM